MASVHEHAAAENLEIVAVYDPWRPASEEAAAQGEGVVRRRRRQCRSSGRSARPRRRRRGVHRVARSLARRAARRPRRRPREHVYVEKPMANEIGELNRAYTAANGSVVVIQVGTQIAQLAPWHGVPRTAEVGQARPHLADRTGAQRRQAVLVPVSQARRAARPTSTGRPSPRAGRGSRSIRSCTPAGHGLSGSSRRPGPHVGRALPRHGALRAALACPSRACAWAASTRGRRAPLHRAGLRCRRSGTTRTAMISYSTNFGNSAGNLTRFAGDKGLLGSTGRTPRTPPRAASIATARSAGEQGGADRADRPTG